LKIKKKGEASLHLGVVGVEKVLWVRRGNFLVGEGFKLVCIVFGTPKRNTPGRISDISGGGGGPPLLQEAEGRRFPQIKR